MNSWWNNHYLLLICIVMSCWIYFYYFKYFQIENVWIAFYRISVKPIFTHKSVLGVIEILHIRDSCSCCHFSEKHHIIYDLDDKVYVFRIIKTNDAYVTTCLKTTERCIIIWTKGLLSSVYKFWKIHITLYHLQVFSI